MPGVVIVVYKDQHLVSEYLPSFVVENESSVLVSPRRLLHILLLISTKYNTLEGYCSCKTECFFLVSKFLMLTSYVNLILTLDLLKAQAALNKLSILVYCLRS